MTKDNLSKMIRNDNIKCIINVAFIHNMVTLFGDDRTDNYLDEFTISFILKLRKCFTKVNESKVEMLNF